MRQEASKYDWDVNIVTAISEAESHCRVDAKGDTTLTYEQNGRIYGYSVSAMQVRILPGREPCDSYDLEVNMRCAYTIYLNSGSSFTPWTKYLNGEYLNYM